MWSSTTTKISQEIYTVQIKQADKAMTFQEVLCEWQSNSKFVDFFCHQITSSPFSALRWETPPICSQTINQEFEFALVHSPGLIRKPNISAFQQHFSSSSGSSTLSFPNLGGDAIMIVPVPLDSAHQKYVHLKSFLAEAASQQVHYFWKVVGETTLQQLNSQKIWLSTAGMGVAWLHARIDTIPKYYAYNKYRNKN